MVLALGVDLHDSFDDLWRSWASLDKRMREWSSTLDARWLEEQLTYTSKVDSVTRDRVPMGSRRPYAEPPEPSQGAGHLYP